MKQFTPNTQEALALARKEADRFNHNFIGTEHLLLALITLGQGAAVNVLRKMGIDLETVRLEVEKWIGTGPDQKMMGTIPYTPRVKKVLNLAGEEATALSHTYVGTEHILLGLLREGEGVAGRVLRDLGVELDKTRQEILRELSPTAEGTESSPLESTSVPTKAGMPLNVAIATPQGYSVDISKRYDVYCREGSQDFVVYRNALFKGPRHLFQRDQSDLLSEFVELEQADGQPVFIARSSIVKFCEHVVPPA